MTAQGSHFLRDLLVLLFAVTAGLTLSGSSRIAAS